VLYTSGSLLAFFSRVHYCPSSCCIFVQAVSRARGPGRRRAPWLGVVHSGRRTSLNAINTKNEKKQKKNFFCVTTGLRDRSFFRVGHHRAYLCSRSLSVPRAVYLQSFPCGLSRGLSGLNLGFLGVSFFIKLPFCSLVRTSFVFFGPPLLLSSSTLCS